MKSCLAILAIAVCLPACSVQTPKGAVVVKPAPAAQPPAKSDGKFCPPGQRKKGNC